MRRSSSANSAREGGAFRYSTTRGSSPLLRMSAWTLREVAQSGSWKIVTVTASPPIRTASAP